MQESLRTKAEVLSHIAGVLGFLLAAALAIPQLVELSRSRRIRLRLTPDPDVPFASVRGIYKSTSSATFALYHDGGRELRIDAVVLRIPRQSRRLPQPGASVSGGGFGDGGMYEVKKDATFYYLWQVDGLGEVVPVEARSLPFASGDTRYYSAPVAGPLSELKTGAGGPVAVTLDVWSQGRVLRSFDVTNYIRHHPRVDPKGGLTSR